MIFSLPGTEETTTSTPTTATPAVEGKIKENLYQIIFELVKNFYYRIIEHNLLKSILESNNKPAPNPAPVPDPNACAPACVSPETCGSGTCMCFAEASCVGNTAAPFCNAAATKCTCSDSVPACTGGQTCTAGTCS